MVTRVNKWTDSEQGWLIELAKCMTVSEIAIKLERSEPSVRSKMIHIGISPVYKNNHWTIKEVTILKSMLKDFNYREIGEHLNRSPASVHSFVKNNKLAENKRANREKIESLTPKVLKLFDEGKSMVKISKNVHLNEHTVKKVLVKEGRL